jgi:hypothetical protein
MKRGRFVKLAALAGMLVLSAGATRSAQAAGLAASPTRVQAFPGPGAVLLTYSTALNATGYNVYRRGASEAADKAVLVNSTPTPYTWVIDDNKGAGLANGAPLIYFVKAVQADGAESAASGEVVVTPQTPILGGLYVHDIGTTEPSTVTLEGTTLTVRAAGHELWDAQDEGTFIGATVAGDYSVSVKMLERPTGGHPRSGKAGVMIREGLASGDRYAILVAMTGRGVYFERRLQTGGGTLPSGDAAAVAEQGTLPEDTTYPLWLKLTKEGAIVSAFQSSDGTTYEQVGTEADFGRMPPLTHAGLGFSAVNVSDPAAAEQYLTAKFDASSFKIE